MLWDSVYCRIIVHMGMFSGVVLSCFLSHIVLLELLKNIFTDHSLLIAHVLLNSLIRNERVASFSSVPGFFCCFLLPSFSDFTF